MPRVPVLDAPGADEPLYRHIYKHIRDELPKAGRAKQGRALIPSALPSQLTGALMALYGHYAKVFARWEMQGRKTPPVFIVVCNNTATSQLVFQYISRTGMRMGRLVAGALPLFSNVTDDAEPAQRTFVARPRTILIDSEELESGEALSPEFKQMAGREIEAFKSELRLRGRAAEAEALSDADLLREVMNTVGQQGRLGEQVRCVVSVSMLTEGWDARTVTHVVGVRAFGTQLLCEQVVGRALRRVWYEADENGFYAPEYADVLGIPFNFIPAGSVADFTPPKQVTWVRALKEREAVAIDFPRVLGYRVVLPPGRLEARFSDDSRMVVTPEDAPPSAVNAAIVGENVEVSLDELRGKRDATVAFRLAGYTLRQWFRDAEGALKP